MNNTLKKIVLLAFAIIMVSALTMLPAFADLTSSVSKTTTVNGYSYTFDSTIHNEVKGRIGFQANVWTTAGSLPTGYMGVRARLYDYNTGEMVGHSDYTFNALGVNFLLESDVYYPPAGYNGYYYSWGEVCFWDGTHYIFDSAYPTPNFQITRAHSLSPHNISIQRNANGEIYGSELFLSEIGVNPDLILARGTDDVIGYVRADDIKDDGVHTPEDAAAYMMNRQPRSVPLYESDGETVIGTFVIG